MHALMRIHACASTRKPARDFARTPGWAVSIDTIFSRNLFWKSPHKALSLIHISEPTRPY